MRAVILTELLGLSALIASGPAWAGLPDGDEVSVNPLPASGGNTLLYPGGQYMRVVKPLLQPGESARDAGPIRLHMPVHGAAGRAASAAPSPAKTAPPKRATAAAPPRRAVAAAPKPAASKPAASKPAPTKQTASAAPSSGDSYTPSYGIFAAPPGAGLTTEPSLGEPKNESAPPKPQTAPRQQTAKAEPPPPARPLMAQEPPTPGLTKRSVILFSAGASDPAKKALDSIKFLAGDLNAAMVNQGSRVQLLAYGGEKGDKGSDARRLSLKRALAIRQVLIDDGVPSERIDVRAMGGADDGGPADRVDVFVKT
ncbi:MAG TPA: OmpA family protein [Rhizomicrobium sp.]|nr:OmpA family protein [Rhizomicrobium sp.]